MFRMPGPSPERKWIMDPRGAELAVLAVGRNFSCGFVFQHGLPNFLHAHIYKYGDIKLLYTNRFWVS